MTNLTPSEARRLIDKLHHNQTKEHGISILEEKYLAALEIALTVLERVKSSTAEALGCCDVSKLSIGEQLIIKAAIYELNHPLIPAPEKKDAWISCSERMPPDDDFVHIWPIQDFGVDVHVGQYMKFHKKGPGWFVQTYGRDEIEWNSAVVTHWQALPPPPQPQTDTYRQIENDGWIEFGGNKAPVDLSTKVQVRWKDGDVDKGKCSHFHWGRNCGNPIIAYRVIEKDGREG